MKAPEIKSFGEHALLLQWEAAVSKSLCAKIMQVDAFVSEKFSKVIIENVPAYTSLVIYLKDSVPTDMFSKELNEALEAMVPMESKKSRTIVIPVCYDVEYGQDLEAVAHTNKLSVEAVIKIHSEGTYQVSFIGFLPGFPYLANLDRRLYTPRKASPRERIVQGSVGIGGSQTGIYTVDSPGGWNIIGRTPLSFFDVQKDPPSLLLAGDTIKIRPISKNEFKKIEIEVATKIYTLETEA